MVTGLRKASYYWQLRAQHTSQDRKGPFHVCATAQTLPFSLLFPERRPPLEILHKPDNQSDRRRDNAQNRGPGQSH